MCVALNALVIGLVTAATVAAQEVCTSDRVSFFYAVEPCVEAVPVQPLVPVPPPVYPLFTPQTVAPHTPPLMLELLQHPTLENAQRYDAWDQQRQAHIRAAASWLGLLRRPQKSKEAP